MNNIPTRPQILMVDDDEFLLSLYAKKIDGYDVDLHVAHSGSEALQKLRDGLTPKVVVVDIEMPEMDGFEIIRNIRKENLAPHAVIAVLTNKSGDEFIEEAEDLKIDQYMIKAALLPSEVLAEVIKLLEKSASK